MNILELIRLFLSFPTVLKELVEEFRAFRLEFKKLSDEKWAKEAGEIREQFEKSSTEEQRLEALRRLSDLQRRV